LQPGAGFQEIDRAVQKSMITSRFSAIHRLTSARSAVGSSGWRPGGTISSPMTAWLMRL
jgi:hypothetical protein